jgi:protein-tyrosine-phosphatase
MKLFSKLEDYLEDQQKKVSTIDQGRRQMLEPLVNYLRENPNGKLSFICTHNSRRSHISAILAQAISLYFNWPIKVFSGGTETTAFNPMAVETLKDAGFKIDKISSGSNPEYKIAIGESLPELVAFSKRFDHSENPKQDFVAILTCSEAQKDCPFIPGAEVRIALPYIDPKVADGTPKMAKAYDHCRDTIATELLYVFQVLKGQYGR